MQRMIFLNLPVADVAVSTAFYAALGFAKNEMFSNDSCTYIAIEDNIALMLHEDEHFAQFVNGDIAHPDQGTAHLIALSADSRDEVESLTKQAVDAGAGPWKPAQDAGYMYGTSFTDPDGHVLEVMWMDVAAAAADMAAAQA